MKRFLILPLICILLTVFTVVSAEERSEGVVIMTDDWKSLADTDLRDIFHDQEPFIPENMGVTLFDQIQTSIIRPSIIQDNMAIFGRDSRVTVGNPASYPYSAIAYMVIEGKCGCSWTGTGFMVGKDRLLTASHCLVCTDHSSFAKFIDFYFGYRNSSNYLYHYGGPWSAWAGNTFTDRSYSTVNDFGCVLLRENVGDTVGWFGSYWDLSNSQLESKLLNAAGYRDGILRYDTGWVNTQDKTHMSFQLDTEPGYSGGPIFDSDNYAVGIIIAEFEQYNVGFRLTGDVRSNLFELQ